MNTSSTAEPIHAPELAMEDLFPVEGEANARTARTRERIDNRRGAREVAGKTKQECGTVTPTVPPSFPFKSKAGGTVSTHRATWSTGMPHLPQMIPRVGGWHKESGPTKPSRRAPGLGQSIINLTRRRDVADVSHDPQPPRHQDYQRLAVPSRTSRLQLPPLYPANSTPDDLNYNDTIETREAREVFPAS